MEIETKLSKLSTIPDKSLRQLHKYIDAMHSHDIVTQLIEQKELIELELFEGKLYIQLVDDNIKYKFIPNEKFEELVTKSIIDKKSTLVEEASNKLKAILTKTYKDIF